MSGLAPTCQRRYRGMAPALVSWACLVFFFLLGAAIDAMMPERSLVAEALFVALRCACPLAGIALGIWSIKAMPAEAGDGLRWFAVFGIAFNLGLPSIVLFVLIFWGAMGLAPDLDFGFT